MGCDDYTFIRHLFYTLNKLSVHTTPPSFAIYTLTFVLFVFECSLVMDVLVTPLVAAVSRRSDDILIVEGFNFVIEV
jgi:hypothetical protein